VIVIAARSLAPAHVGRLISLGLRARLRHEEGQPTAAIPVQTQALTSSVRSERSAYNIERRRGSLRSIVGAPSRRRAGFGCEDSYVKKTSYDLQARGG
jgi:hypothetical protein